MASAVLAVLSSMLTTVSASKEEVVLDAWSEGPLK